MPLTTYRSMGEGTKVERIHKQHQDMVKYVENKYFHLNVHHLKQKVKSNVERYAKSKRQWIFDARLAMDEMQRLGNEA